MDAPFLFNYNRTTGFLDLRGWERLTVAHLRRAIWVEKKELKSLGVLAASRLSLWKEGGQTALHPLDKLQTVFHAGEQKTVHVTPVTANAWDAGFVVGGTPVSSFTNAAGTCDRSRDLAKQLLVPFPEIPKSVEEVRRALESRLLRKIPLNEEFFKDVADCPLAFEMFKLETPEDRAVRITSVVQSAICFCLYPGYVMHGITMQSYLNSIFCCLWNPLLDLAGIGSIRYSRNTGSGSGASSGLLLRVHGKEVFYGEEDSGLGTDVEQQVRKKLKGFLDPEYFLDMSHMICYAAEDLTLRVQAVSGVESVPLLSDMSINNTEGLLRSIRLSINLLRIAVTWEPGFANTPARKLANTPASEEL